MNRTRVLHGADLRDVLNVGLDGFSKTPYLIGRFFFRKLGGVLSVTGDPTTTQVRFFNR